MLLALYMRLPNEIEKNVENQQSNIAPIGRNESSSTAYLIILTSLLIIKGYSSKSTLSRNLRKSASLRMP